VFFLIMHMRPVIIGAGFGLILSAIAFATIPAYHNYLVWAWSTPILWLVGLPVGVGLAVLTD
jgi:hypothetical protein